MIIVTKASKMGSTPTKDKLIKDLSDFHLKTGLSLTVIGRRSINDNSLWARLNNGGTITIDKLDAIYAWMREYSEIDKGIQPPLTEELSHE